MTSHLVDFHCHLDLYPDHPQIVDECDRAGIFTLAVTTTPRAWSRNQVLASKTKYVRAALGLHPQLVRERASELGLWREYLPSSRYVGEVGLDAGPRFYSSFDIQKQVFETILRDCADQGGKILTIHSVRAARQVIDMLEAFLPRSRGTAVLHWFTGTRSEAERAIRLGAYFSINREMLRHERHSKTVAALPIDRLLTETDGPFVQIEGRPARPSDVRETIEDLARLRAMPSAELAEIVAKNLKRLVSE
ncbi:Qat anti-phage system TatD family nuclease QatD [Bradyrhizobium sp. 14AA]